MSYHHTSILVNISFIHNGRFNLNNYQRQIKYLPPPPTFSNSSKISYRKCYQQLIQDISLKTWRYKTARVALAYTGKWYKSEKRHRAYYFWHFHSAAGHNIPVVTATREYGKVWMQSPLYLERGGGRMMYFYHQLFLRPLIRFLVFLS
jgi:hypothetical protein